MKLKCSIKRSTSLLCVIISSMAFAGCFPSALGGSAARGNTQKMQLLLDQGEDINKKSYGVTPLMAAAEHERVAAVQLLLDRGADVNATATTMGASGMTALMYAVWRNPAAVFTKKNPDNIRPIASLLLEKGANINAQDKSGRTALLYAVDSGHITIVSFLIDKGADVNIKNKAGVSVLEVAERTGYTDIAKLLKNAGAR